MAVYTRLFSSRNPRTWPTEKAIFVTSEAETYPEWLPPPPPSVRGRLRGIGKGCHFRQMAATALFSVAPYPHRLPLETPILIHPLKTFPRLLRLSRRSKLGIQPKPRRPISSQAQNDSADPPDRLISAVCYFYPFFDGIQYGKYVMAQFSPIQVLLQPLYPAIKVFKGFPLNGFLVFLTLYFVVVRNPNFSRYVRFNTMQAIVLDVLLIFPDLLERTLNPKDGISLDLMMSFDSTVFLYLLVCLIYGSTSCLFGQVPRLPIVAEAAERQVP